MSAQPLVRAEGRRAHFWAWDASIDEDGKRIFARDGNGIISVDIASGDRTQIFAESYTNGDLAGPVGLTLSANRKYAYNFTRWVSSLRRTNLETGEIEVVQFTNRNTPEAYNYSEHHSVAAKFGKNGEAFYQMTANNINIYSPDGELKTVYQNPQVSHGALRWTKPRTLLLSSRI